MLLHRALIKRQFYVAHTAIGRCSLSVQRRHSCGRVVDVGIVGVGGFGSLHANAISTVEGARLTCIIEPNAKNLDDIRWNSSRELLEFSSLTHAFQSHAKLPKAWIVASPSSTHVEICRELLNRGFHVLCEKPLAQSYAEAASLAGTNATDKLMLGHVALFNSEFQVLLDEVTKRGRDSIELITLERHRPSKYLLDPKSPYFRESPFDLTMVHNLYLLQSLLNGSSPTAYWAQAHGDPVHTAAACISFADCAAHITAAHLIPAGGPADGFDRVHVYGATWAAHATANPRPIQVWDSDRAHWPYQLEIQNTRGMLHEQLRAFLNFFRGVIEQPPRGTTYADAMQILDWTAQLKLSAATNRSLPLSKQCTVQSMQKADAHIHIFEGGYKLGSFGSRSGVALDEAACFHSLAQDHHVEHALVVGYAADEFAKNNNEFIATMAQKYAWMHPLAYFDPDDLTVAALEELEEKFVGIALYIFSDDSAQRLLEVAAAVWEWLATRHWLVSVNSKGQLWSMWESVALKSPNLIILCSHLGLPEPRAIPAHHPHAKLAGAEDTLNPVLALARFKNCFVKLSGFYALSRPACDYPHTTTWPHVHDLLKAFGAKRLLWGSDFSPAIDDVTYPQTYHLFDHMPFLSFADKESIVGANLRAILSRVQRNTRGSGQKESDISISHEAERCVGYLQDLVRIPSVNPVREPLPPFQ